MGGEVQALGLREQAACYQLHEGGLRVFKTERSIHGRPRRKTTRQPCSEPCEAKVCSECSIFQILPQTYYPEEDDDEVPTKSYCSKSFAGQRQEVMDCGTYAQ